MNARYAVVAAACAASLSVGLAAAQSTFQTISGHEFFTGHQEGVVNCQGSAAPTGNFLYPCGPGVGGTIRDRVVYASVVTADPRFSGPQIIVSNVNFDGNGEGPMWGTFELQLPDGGTLAGTFSGTVNLTNLTMQLQGVGHGSGGSADGLQAKIDDVHGSPPPMPGDLLVRLLNPGGKH